MSEEILNATIDGVPNARLHIQNIPPHVTEAHLRTLFGNAGYFIKDVCYFNKNKKQSNNNFVNKKIYNTALITFNTHEEALNVLKNIKNLIDTSNQEKSIEAKFAVPNVNNNSTGKNNSGHAGGGNTGNNGNLGNNNFQNNFNNNDDFNNGSGMSNYNFYNNSGGAQNNLANRNVKGKNTNNGMMMMKMMNMNNVNNTNSAMNTSNIQMNNALFNQKNNFMLNNNNYGNGKNLNDSMKIDEEFPTNKNANIGNMNNLTGMSNMNIGGEGDGRGNNYNNHGGNSPISFRQNGMQNNNNGNMLQANDMAMDDSIENVEGLSLWEIYKDKNNNTFYYNNLTKHSQWNKPIHPNKLFQYNNNEKTKLNGPNGSNLFIFHIPSEWSDLDLFQHFCCFGNIISSKIQRDNTGRNSGFGFVSYDNTMSAHHAIQFMNGYFVNNKYLKVQLKKGEASEKTQA
ncbi:clustered-asparagine-rich protein [Plasmodium gonderi]|uniref:Clustered-asparagine-rich protein n=1 Tax=Plasmodium gonderi TaxID=77519 RepID=A0A1Y1JMB4_PLAGO|nr:clustered-asparagine-rich protein [Plasmodium gonderi]GAW83736.1 clustered-asparagine-rich protein [Plasmodium gonderi]